MSKRTNTLLWRNAVSLTGAALAVISALFILSLLFLDVVTGQPNPYLGLLTYLVFPGLVVVGGVMMVSGVALALRRHRRQQGTANHVRYYPRVNLNLPHHRHVLFIIGAAIAVVIPLVGILSYEGYHYTDSDQFCGLVCHAVMEPQYTTYLKSPHAKVNCAECHIGPGASWYVKSKLSGVRQVLSVATDSFPRPIPPAIQELRPATETCRECHWPAKYFGDELVTIEHFASDEANTRHRLRMLLKVGGSDRSTGPPSGIHWHMALGFTIEYVAVDDHLQDIPWVRIVDDSTSNERIYRSDGKSVADPPPPGTRRVVDCMDCHNRPAHMFRSPDRAVDLALNVDPPLQSLPFAKREAVRALVQPYVSKSDGLAGVPLSIEWFYQKQMPDVWEARRSDIERLKNVAVDIYRTNFFPEMNVNWRTYQDNIGHKHVQGCFRCHGGRHVDATGNPISHECSVCHVFLQPRHVDDPSSLVQTAGFVHPMKLEGSHAMLRCDQCHTGGVSPSRTCEGCHTMQHEFRAASLSAFASFSIPPDPMLESVSCDGCHDLSEPTNFEMIDTACMDCHEDEGERFDGLLASWHREVDQLLSDAETGADERGRQLLQKLRAAGPLHNIEATRMLIRSLAEESGSSTVSDHSPDYK